MTEKKTRSKKWIQKAINPEHKGEFSEKAKKAGKSTLAYASEHEEDSGKLGKQARLAKTLMKMTKKHHAESASHKDIRKTLYGEKE